MEDVNTYYSKKAKGSFTTKFQLFLFNLIINQDNNNELKIEWSDFEKFTITKDLKDIYTSYYQEYYDETPSYQNNKKTIREIQNAFKLLWDENNPKFNENSKKMMEKYEKEIFPKVFPKDKFIEIYSQKNCHYCGITIDEKINEILELANNEKIYKKTNRGYSLEMDRFDSNDEYSYDNCAMACYWCNNAKTDEFTETEFKIIGKAIREVWEQRLGKSLKNSII